MKNDGIYAKTMVFFLLALCVNLSACLPPSIRTEAIVINESSHDLRIVFASIPLTETSQFMRIIDINQGESAEFFSFWGSPGQDPYMINTGAIDIIMYTLVAGKTGEIIKEMDAKGNKSIFEFMGYNKNTALYQFKITDELLQN
ncbi:MAG: hypothetical protein FWE09_05335 [Treponema sp.]|nr:hypothetical protein [Treponema sp.]